MGRRWVTLPLPSGGQIENIASRRTTCAGCKKTYWDLTPESTD